MSTGCGVMAAPVRASYCFLRYRIHLSFVGEEYVNHVLFKLNDWHRCSRIWWLDKWMNEWIKYYIPSKHEAFTQCCFNVGPASKTVGQHWNSIGWMPRVCWVAHVSSRRLFRALNIESNLARPVIIQIPTQSPERYTAELPLRRIKLFSFQANSPYVPSTHTLDGNCAHVHWGSFTSNSRSVRRAIWFTWFSKPHECIQHLAVTRRSPIQLWTGRDVAQLQW